MLFRANRLLNRAKPSQRSTDVTSNRLRDADLAESLGSVWSLVEPAEPKPTPKWVAPLGAQRHRVEQEERAHA